MQRRYGSAVPACRFKIKRDINDITETFYFYRELCAKLHLIRLVEHKIQQGYIGVLCSPAWYDIIIVINESHWFAPTIAILYPHLEMTFQFFTKIIPLERNASDKVSFIHFFIYGIVKLWWGCFLCNINGVIGLQCISQFGLDLSCGILLSRRSNRTKD